MGLKMKDRYAALDLSKLPKTYQDEFDEMKESTKGFSDNELNEFFEDNFNEMYSLVVAKYPGAIKKGGTIQKPKTAKNKIVKPKTVPKQLPKVNYKNATYFVDFKLEELRQVEKPFMNIKFSDLGWDPELKAKVRGIRAEAGPNVYIASLDYMPKSAEVLRKKLSQEDIIFVEDQLTNDEESTDEEMIAHFVIETGMSEEQAKKWVMLRDKYIHRMSPEESLDYPTRTDQKKRARKGSDLVSTRDNVEFDRKSHKNVGKKFYDENGKQWQCVGYNAKLDECILKDADGKQISSCIKDMYTSNPVAKREKGNIVDECKETLKEAGYTVKSHKSGNKKLSRSEPRPEKVIIKERVEESFTPIMKDLRGSEDKEKENKLIIDILEEIQGSFTKFMNRISNLADDRKLDALKKIKKLLDEIID